MIPTDGSYIKFTRVPAGSFAKAETVYHVRVERSEIWLHNEFTGASTCDRASMYRSARWEYV